MQNRDMVEKRRIYADGVLLDGLVNVPEYVLEKGTVEVPGFDILRPVQNNVKKLTPLEAIFKIQRNSQTIKRLNDWFDNNEVHDVVMERTDAHGNVFETIMYPDCEMNKNSLPAYDASNPTYAQVSVRFMPWDFGRRSA